ncbi:hypothetical protein TrRE_jg3349 [Triparma retinervis]|jgi:hypothetical protein|uniref:J domain-containing protein n=1 Tax=Triparma retinervis TaxID=2557542 RepID=A0A9W7E619_9STRA|nr:hypothetical protein TrRE_jg3349 [Triparma retinervis]
MANFSLESVIESLEGLRVEESGEDSNLAWTNLLESTTSKLHQDPYLCLGLPQHASQGEIAQSFRKLALKYHPDKNRSPHAASIFREIKHAQDLLGGEESRKAFDEEKRREKLGKIHVGPRSRARTKSKPKPPPQPMQVSHDGRDLQTFRNDGRNKCLTSVSFCSGVERVGKCAFMYAENLVSVTIPDGVKVLGENSFKGCNSLTHVSLPEGLREIGGYAFNGCSSLITLVLPSTVESLGSYCFSYCKELKSVNVPEGVTKIGTGPFTYCAKVVPHGLISTNDTDAVVAYLRGNAAPANTGTDGKPV